MTKVAIAKFDELEDRKPAHALVANVDLVVVRFDETALSKGWPPRGLIASRGG